MKKKLLSMLVIAGFAITSMSFINKSDEVKNKTTIGLPGEVQGWAVLTINNQIILFTDIACADDYIANYGGQRAGVGYDLPQNIWACY